MFEAKCNKGEVKIHADGDIAELCADVMTIINSLYCELFEKSVLNAVFFRDCFEHNLSDVFVLNFNDDEKKEED